MHFTQADNIPGIVEHGLLSRARLQALDEVSALATSGERLDREIHAISVSISAINAEMFWAKDRACGHPPWVVLLLDPSILWTQDCCFFWRNAASKEVREHSGFLGGPYGLRRIFEDVSFKWPPESHRTEAGVPHHLPTFSDAEVQVFNAIGPQRIMGAWVTDVELGGVVDGHLKRLRGFERTVFVRPFAHLKLGTSTWLVPRYLAPETPSA
jgi:hypothetical protein